MPGGRQLMITGSYLLDSWRLRSGACGLKEIHVPYPNREVFNHMLGIFYSYLPITMTISIKYPRFYVCLVCMSLSIITKIVAE